MDDHWVACPLAVVHFRSPHLAPNVHRGMGRWSGVGELMVCEATLWIGSGLLQVIEELRKPS